MNSGLRPRVLGWLLAGLAMMGMTACDRAAEPETWLSRARLDAEESPEALYESALKEGTLLLYSNSSRVFDTKEAFERAYPGLTVDIQFIRAVDIVEILMEKERGAYVSDLVICSDTFGALSTQLVDNGTLHRYLPADLEGTLELPLDDGLLYFMLEATQLFYRGEDYAAPPVHNWWQLTEPQFRGKLYMVDPIRSFSNYSFLTMTIRHSDEMARAYRDLYGEELQVPPGSTAGQEFWRRLVANEVHFVSTSDEIYDIVGLPGGPDGALGITVSSKARKSALGYTGVPIFELAPTPGVMAMSCIMMVEDARCVSTAKLFVRYLLGETDGTGEGYQPYLQEGSWSVRGDVPSATGISYEDAGFWLLDKAWYAEHNEWIMEFWLSLHGPEQTGAE